MKRTVSMLLCLVMLAGLLSGCGQSAAKEQSKNRLEEILERGYVTVATEPYFAPEEFIDPSKEGDEQYVGSDIELAKYIAEKLGVECRIVPLDFTTVLSSVTEGKYDLAISALAYKPDRAENMNLSKTYFLSDDADENSYGFAVSSALSDSVKSLEDLNDKVVVVQQGSLQQFIWETYGGACKELKYVSSTNDAFMMVTEGKADAVITATSFARLYIEANAGCNINMVEDYRFPVSEDYLGMVIGMKKGEDELTARINEIIDEVVASGIYKEWRSTYAAYAASLGL
ncbi:MAG: amino acid ABC transporter substrate-binding protein [Oscillospiraceae bacterium]|nr:amino acid ABC transporter substrate-binding protein [Bacillota bacterium]MBR0040217.1 amino acid ABC transporter substrate-binding protein [Oscillospiraceae bacterium]